MKILQFIHFLYLLAIMSNNLRLCPEILAAHARRPDLQDGGNLFHIISLKEVEREDHAIADRQFLAGFLHLGNR